MSSKTKEMLDVVSLHVTDYQINFRPEFRSTVQIVMQLFVELILMALVSSHVHYRTKSIPKQCLALYKSDSISVNLFIVF